MRRLPDRGPLCPPLIAVAIALSFARLAPAQLTSLGAVTLTQCPAPGDCLEEERFGRALAAGDFDGDGFDDLAVGNSETISGDILAGSVQVFYGSPGGLTHTGEQFFSGDSSGISGSAEPFDIFGAALLADDFDHDGFDDLAIGVPGEDVGSIVDAGTVVVLFGSASGLLATGSLTITQDTVVSSPESAEEDDQFGLTLATDGNGGLAVGAPGETFLPLVEQNAGTVLRFGDLAPSTPPTFVTQLQQNDFLDDCGAADGNEAFDRWGSAMVALDLFSFVVAGAAEDHSGVANAGRIWVIDTFSDCFDQNSSGVQETAEEDDTFGDALAAGDFNDDGDPDLAIGVPGEDNGPEAGGIVQVLFGIAGGLTADGDQFFGQDNFPDETRESGDRFGEVLVSGRFDGDGHSDLAIGVPEEGIGSASRAGEVNIRYGSSTGFNTDFDQTLNSDSPGMPDSSNDDDELGKSLAVGDFDGNLVDDLAIGAPGEALGSEAAAGAVTLLYGRFRNNGAFGFVRLSDNALTVSEAGAGELVVLHRDGGAVIAASVDHLRTGGSATPGVDFAYTPGTASWAVGDVGTEFFIVNPHNDTLDEPNETLTIALANPSTGLALGLPSSVTITITDDDVGGVVSFALPQLRVREDAGEIEIEVVRTNGAASGVTVQYATSNLSATAGSDYTARSGTLAFAANETSQTITVPILDDGAAEPEEVFVVTLSNPGGGATLGPTTQFLAVIVSDEIFFDGFESGNTSLWSSVVP